MGNRKLKTVAKIFTMAATLITTILVFGLINTTPTQATNHITVLIDGQQVQFPDQEPVNIDGRTLVPVRGVFETLGFTVGWDGETRTAILTNSQYEIRLMVDNSTFTVNGWQHLLDVPPQLINGRTMIPIAIPLRQVGYEVGWDGSTQTVLITTPHVTTVIEPTPIPTPEPTQESTTLTINSQTTFRQLMDAGYDYEEAFDIIEHQIFLETNRIRREHNVSELEWDNRLAQAARNHSQDMTENNTSGHVGTDGSMPHERAQALGWPGVPSENFGRTGLNGSAAGMVQSWYDSPAHRDNMLNPRWTHFGAGVYIMPLTDEIWVGSGTVKFGDIRDFDF